MTNTPAYLICPSARICKYLHLGAVLTTEHFLCNLRMDRISWSVTLHWTENDILVKNISDDWAKKKLMALKVKPRANVIKQIPL